MTINDQYQRVHIIDDEGNSVDFSDSSGNPLDSYVAQSQNVANGYFGYLNPSNGDWYILWIPNTDPCTYGYATGTGGASAFVTAFTNPSALTFVTADEAFGG